MKGNKVNRSEVGQYRELIVRPSSKNPTKHLSYSDDTLITKDVISIRRKTRFGQLDSTTVGNTMIRDVGMY